MISIFKLLPAVRVISNGVACTEWHDQHDMGGCGATAHSVAGSRKA